MVPDGADKNEKKQAILSAMLDLIVERGLQNAPMSELARRAGASPGVIYHYFPSKDDLIHAVYLRVKQTKLEALLVGYSADTPPRETLLQLWLNAYRFYRTHQKEMRFLDQYLNSPACGAEGREAKVPSNPATARIMRLTQPKKKGGVLKDLPPEAIEHLTFGLAARLAKAHRSFPQATLEAIAASIWTAIAEE